MQIVDWSKQRARTLFDWLDRVNCPTTLNMARKSGVQPKAKNTAECIRFLCTVNSNIKQVNALIALFKQVTSPSEITLLAETKKQHGFTSWFSAAQLQQAACLYIGTST